MWGHVPALDSAHMLWFRCLVRCFFSARISEITIKYFAFTLSMLFLTDFIWNIHIHFSNGESITLKVQRGSCFWSSGTWLQSEVEPSTSLGVTKDGTTRRHLRSDSGSWAGCYTDPCRCWHRSFAAGSGRNNHHTPAAIRQAANSGSWCG